jgi:ParB-like chromosome segregation protein Spo0J
MNRQPALRGNGFAVSRDLNPILVSLDALKPLGRLTRKHPPKQIQKLAESLEEIGFVLPLVIGAESRVVAGWGLVLAARKMGLTEAPAVIISDLDEAKLRLLRLALNRLGEESSWDAEALKLESCEVLEISGEIDLRISGFEMGEIDVAISIKFSAGKWKRFAPRST